MLYKKDTKGKIRQLNITAKDGWLYQESGRVGGKLVEHGKERKPKNVGKSNATTSITQAEKEAKALIIKKLREGYFNTKAEALSSNVMLPMLAKDYFKEKHKLTKQKTVGIQPKLDGIRCNVHCDLKNDTIKALSRMNVPIKNIDHILEELKNYLAFYAGDRDEIIFDGELYLHGHTFQEVTKLVNNKPDKVFVEYHIYDVMDANLSFLYRDDLLDEISLGNDLQYTRFVETTIVNNTPDHLEFAYTNYIKLGYEGMMVRVLESLYKIAGRSSDLLKYKKFIDIALTIVDITPNDANPDHGTVWVKYKGVKQKTGAKLSHKDREELLINKQDYIGKTAEIRYFEETDEGLMRFPKYYGLRIDK